MKQLLPILMMGLMTLCACGEPAPATRTQFQMNNAPLVAGETISFSFEGTSTSVLNLERLAREVFAAEFEDSRWNVLAQDADVAVGLTLTTYDFEARDSNDVVPGWLIPGVLPFGPLGWWLWDQDDDVATPQLTLALTIRCNDVSSTGRTEVVRSVSSEEDLARVALSELARQTRSWLGGEK